MKTLSTFASQHQSQLLHTDDMQHTIGGRRFETTNYLKAIKRYIRMINRSGYATITEHEGTYCVEW